MTTSNSNGNRGLLIGIGLAVAIGLALVVTYVVSMASANAFGAESESQIVATYDNNQNILGQYTAKINEVVQLPKMQQKALVGVLQAAFGAEGRSGNQAAMQWIKESYPGTLDNAMYGRIMTIMDAGRTEFQDNQTTLIDQKRVYTNNLAYTFKGWFLKQSGYPKINLADYKVIKSSQAAKAYDTGLDDGVKITD